MNSERIVIMEHVRSQQIVWTGIPGRYMQAPEEDCTYSFVEYCNENEQHIRFAFEPEGGQPWAT